MSNGQLVVVRRGAYIYDSAATEVTQSLMVPPLAPSPRERPVGGEQAQAGLQHAATGTAVESAPPPQVTQAPPPEAPPEVPEAPRQVRLPALHHHAELEGEGRLLSVRHETVYRYDKAVERSFHLFRLKPVHDRWQDLLHHELTLSVDGVLRDFEDVFGNLAARIEVTEPYTELKLSARSLVRVRGNVPDDLHSPHRRFTIPLVWMPWQRQMMLPYLLPPELPETQLTELTEFAMSFVQRQDFDLVQTLVDMNTTLYRDFAYVSGSTTMATTPFDVFTSRRGVCQDFANLLICLARLLGVPARYRVGYIYTGGDYENKAQSDASHAWAELYLPWTGWQGFDPTNGILVTTDHVRTACGRNYGDATPTSGTIYKGGGRESLKVDVKVEEVEAL
ncbi:MAG: transglutaminase family protein [Deltaproteobacteria bacterium]|nr:transglutaminase family protein [Deltaproteobacteria bacterium]